MSHKFLELISTLCLVIWLNGLQIDAACSITQQFIICVNELITDEKLNTMNGSFALTISRLHSFLRTERQMNDNAGAQINSLQLQRGTILGVDSGFFARYSNRGLRTLSLSHIKGDKQILNARTLTGLEEKLTELTISDCNLFNLNDFAMLVKLKTLRLVRTSLTQLPNNFPQLMEHLDHIDLSENKLTKLPWDVLAKLVQNDNFQKIQLIKNAWKCDCSLRPLIELRYPAKTKIYQFRCHEPANLQKRQLNELTLEDVCTKEELAATSEQVLKPGQTDLKPDMGGSGEPKIDHKPKTIDDLNPLDKASAADTEQFDGQRRVSNAGMMSTELIIIIVAAALVLIIIIMSALIYRARKAAATRKQQERNLGATHKTNSYCAVIEHPTTTRQGKKHSAYSNENDASEHEPLSRQFDHRL